MKNTTARAVAVERRFPTLCKVHYFPGKDADQSPHAPTGQLDWYLRSSMLPRVGDVIPYGQYLFSVTTVILDDCYSSDSLFKLEKQAKRLAEKDDARKPQATDWVEFWGEKSLG